MNRCLFFLKTPRLKVAHQLTNTFLKISLGSVVPNSSFEEISLLGNEDGSLCLQLTVSSDYVMPAKFRKFQELTAYFKDLGFTLEEHGSITLHTPMEIQKLFAVISKYNEIPSEYYSWISRLIAAGKWRKNAFS